MKNIFIQITDRCNLKCRQCDIWKIDKRPELSFNEWKKILDDVEKQFSKEVRVDFTGGEPFIYNDLPKIIRYCTDKGFETCVSTNFTLLTPEKIKEIVWSGLTNLNLSLDGFDNDTLLYLRGMPEHTRRFMRVVEEFDKYEKHPRLVVAMLLLKQNIKDIYKTVELVKKDPRLTCINFQVIFQNFSPLYTIDWYKANEFFPRGDDLKMMLGALDWLIKIKKETKYLITNSLIHLQKIKDYFQFPEKISMEHNCNASESLFFEPDGGVQFCFFHPNIGNLNQSPLNYILNSQVANERLQEMIGCNKFCGFLNCNFTRLDLAILIPMKHESKKLWRQSLEAWKKVKLPHNTKVIWVINHKDKIDYLDELKELKNPFGYFESMMNKGWKAADLNEAIRELEPRYIAVFDIDAIPNENFLLCGMQKLKECDAAQGEKFIYNQNDNWLTKQQTTETAWINNKNRLAEMAGENCRLHGSGMMFKTNSLEKVGLFPISLVEDYRLGILMKNQKIGFINSSYYEEATPSIYNYLLQRSRWGLATKETFWQLYKSSWQIIFMQLLLQLSYIFCFIKGKLNLRFWGHTKKKGILVS